MGAERRWLRWRPSGSARAALVLALMAAYVLALGSAHVEAQDDDWTITREPTASRAPGRPRDGRRPGRPRPATPTVDVDARMVERYLAIVLARPEDDGAVRRLLERASSRPGGVEGLVASLAVRAEALGAAGDLALAAIALARADMAAAEAAIARALSRDPENVAARLLRARAELRSGDRAAAAAALTEAAQREAEGARRDAIDRERALLYVELGRIDEARAIFARLGRHGSVLGRTELVRALAAHGRCADVLTELPDAERAAARDASASVSLALLRARCEREQGDPAAARATLERAWPRALGSGRGPELLDAMVEDARASEGLPALADALAALGPAAALHRGVVLEELGRDDEALRVFEQVLRRQPRDAETRQRVVRLLSRNGRLADALEHQRALARLYPERIALALELAGALRDQGRAEEGLAVLDRARARARRDRTALFLLVDTYARWGERDRVLETLEALVRESPDDPRALSALANELIERGERERGLAILERMARGAGRGVQGELEAARAFANVRVFERALAHLEAAVRLAPDAPEVIEAQAEIFERAGRDDDAERALARRIARGAPTPADESGLHEAEARLVASWARRGRLAAHRDELAQAHARGEESASRMLADVQRRSGDHDGALATLEALASRRPDDVRLLGSLARLHHERGDYAAEVATLRRLADLEPARAGWHFTRLVELALATYRDDDAIAFAEEAARRSVDDAGLALRLGRLHARRRDLARAAAAYARAIAIDPDAFEAAWELATIEREAGRARRALDLYLDILGRSRDDELRERAGRAALELARAEGEEASLEPRLLSLALAHGDAPVFRRLALALYGSLSGAARARGDVAEIERRVSRALPILLASLRDPDVGARAAARQLLFAHPVRGASAALLALASDDRVEPSVRIEALSAALRVIGPGDREALLGLVAGPSEPLAVLALHGLARILPGPERARLLRTLRGADGPLAEHAWVWTLLAATGSGAGREVPAAPPTTSLAWLLVWHARVVGDEVAQRTALAAQTAASRGRADHGLEVAVELAAAGALSEAEIDELARRALTSRETETQRALRILVSEAHPEVACAPVASASETLEAWMVRAIAACPRRPRDPAAVGRALERVTLGLEGGELVRALDRLAVLARADASAIDHILPAARSVAGRVLAASPGAEGALAVVRAKGALPGIVGDDTHVGLLTHPDARVRAEAAATAPLASGAEALLGVVRSDSSWVVRRAALLRVTSASGDAVEAAVEAGLEDRISYVRGAALARAALLPGPRRCELLASRSDREPDPVLARQLAQALADCAR